MDCLDILIIDDDEVDRMNVQYLLGKEDIEVIIHEASDCHSGIEKLKLNNIDCVLIDYQLPGTTGLEVLEKILAVNQQKIPLILLTGMGNEQLASEVMKKGASDYLSKNGLNGKTLVKSMRNAIQVRSYEKKVQAAEKALTEREQSYRTIVETVSDVIFRLGPDEKIEFINPAIRFFGYEPEELIGHTIEKFVNADSIGPEGLAKISTRHVGPMATSNLEVHFNVARESVMGEQIRPVPVLLDAFGLWDVTDEEVFKNIAEKTFLGTLCIARNIMEVKEVQDELLKTQNKLMTAIEELKALSTKDGLTEIANRRFFDEYSEKEWKRAQRDKQDFSVIMIDLDNFKSYNDTYGHQQGDACLKKVAKVIERAMKRPADLAARYGGEEFALILPETDENGAFSIAERLRQQILDLKLEHKGNTCENWVTISLGVATKTAEPGKSFFNLLNKADKELYTAKKSGRNKISSFSEAN